jgi:hypothetical protein
MLVAMFAAGADTRRQRDDQCMVGKGQMTAEYSLCNYFVYLDNKNISNKQENSCNVCGVGKQRIPRSKLSGGEESLEMPGVQDPTLPLTHAKKELTQRPMIVPETLRQQPPELAYLPPSKRFHVEEAQFRKLSHGFKSAGSIGV